MDPKIYLGIDNCFAIKRWVTPSEWGRVIREMGLRYVEGVADLEIEPLLTPQACHDEWIAQVNELKARDGVEVVMMYSNDSTYDTAGFTHPDPRIGAYYADAWFDEFLRISAAIGASVGYYVQGVPEEVLYDKARYDGAMAQSLACMQRVAQLAKHRGVGTLALEQMYTPHQPPFTIDAMRALMQTMYRTAETPLYLTEDVGHHSPNYQKPTDETLRAAFARCLEDGYIPIWLGSLRAQALFRADVCRGTLQAQTVAEILRDAEENGHLFSTARDADCYEWLRELGAWSPVIHLQQTDGKHSSHEPFSPQSNESGIIHPVRLLRALADCYAKPADPTLPPRCAEIYLIQELYLSTKDIGYQGLYKLGWSTDYLRRFIPKDGMTLSALLEYNKNVVC